MHHLFAPAIGSGRRHSRAARERISALGVSLAVLGGGAALGRCDSPAAPPAPPPAAAAPAPVAASSPMATEVIGIVNAERVATGLAPLATNPALVVAADRHSAEQAARGQMTHTGSDGSNAGQRITAAGFTWRTWGENVAYGQTTAAAVMQAWMNSSGHRANILTATFTQIGVSAVTAADGRIFWTMDLAA